MQKTKVRKDKHGFYFRAGGWVFRPIETKWTKSLGTTTKTKFTEGQQVKAKHIGGTPCGKIKKVADDYSEVWSSHGKYLHWDTAQGKTVFLDTETLLDETK